MLPANYLAFFGHFARDCRRLREALSLSTKSRVTRLSASLPLSMAPSDCPSFASTVDAPVDAADAGGAPVDAAVAPRVARTSERAADMRMADSVPCRTSSTSDEYDSTTSDSGHLDTGLQSEEHSQGCKPQPYIPVRGERNARL